MTPADEAGTSGEEGTGASAAAEEGTGASAAAEEADAGGKTAARLSEAEAELAAQRVERARIAARKAAREEPVAAGTKLTGKAAELLAAVRAVEQGERPAATFDAPASPVAPRRTAPPPPRGAEPASVPPAPSAPDPAALEAVAALLTRGGAPEALAPAAVRALGEGAAGELESDPWQLLRLAGVTPEHADAFARALLGAGAGPGDVRRGRALTVRLLEEAALRGHTVRELAELAAALGKHGVPDAEEAVQEAVAEGDALLFQDGVPPAGDEEEEAPPVPVLVGLERYALAEESLADALGRIAAAGAGTEDGWAPAAEAAGRGSAAELIRAAAAHTLVLHTGGEAARAEAAALVSAARGLGLRAFAAAHTAEGRRALATLLGAKEPALTVAGLLSGTQGPARDAEGHFALDLLVVLDAPQLGVEEAALLAESVPDGARLVLSGDPGVLGSAGAGRVFGDLLAARFAPHVVSRTPDPGPVGEFVSGLGVGEFEVPRTGGHEVVVVPVREPGEAVHRTVQLVTDSVPRALGVAPDETQVLVPGHGGAAGTRVLNAALKERLNPGPGRFGGFDPGDRIVWSPAPGRTALGRVVGADQEGLRLECEGTPVRVAPADTGRTVRHAWALTAHQAVGHRWAAVVVVVPGDAVPVLSRAWFYTAAGRAERHLSVVQGTGEALAQAVAARPSGERRTRLTTLLSRPAEG
ncbi:helix-hairpin-helix domain-containing protein [Streptomyces sp. AM 3-1-1]|uniref:helix-hairpin-helix domain-containing protein n=1 Tax=Streptomyces sp. AM 3-1-1 TaxID=3028711 RepID=UPI0023BA36E7|nr:helix-hairpin-helix domain-containing protein [Streptomyces sp. AM 3-1-1]WEH31529.1 helix-hairpin-helix domain-containing protein [Streptomyces sp. AM 3-1-1]